MSPIRTGLIGFGNAGTTLHAPLIELEPGLALQAIASSRRDAIEQAYPHARAEASAVALINAADIELVVIASPNQSHFPLARHALQAGRHVVIDKPFALDTRQADELIALAHTHRRKLSVFHNRRWDGDFLTLAACIERGVLGEVSSFESHFDRFRPAIKQGWREEAEPGAGILFDLGSHLIDQALVLFGMPDAIGADVLLQREHAYVDDYFHLQLHYGRRRAILHASTLAPAPGARFTAHGPQASFVKYGLDTQEGALKAGQVPGGSHWGEDSAALFASLTHGDGRVERLPTLPGNYPAFYRGMAAAIATDGDVPVPATQARDVLRIIEAAMRSSASGLLVRPG
jgi:scyllo-inositol 2-dehydrogenase (NADP+)